MIRDPVVLRAGTYEALPLTTGASKQLLEVPEFYGDFLANGKVIQPNIFNAPCKINFAGLDMFFLKPSKEKMGKYDLVLCQVTIFESHDIKLYQANSILKALPPQISAEDIDQLIVWFIVPRDSKLHEVQNIMMNKTRPELVRLTPGLKQYGNDISVSRECWKC